MLDRAVIVWLVDAFSLALGLFASLKVLAAARRVRGGWARASAAPWAAWGAGASGRVWCLVAAASLGVYAFSRWAVRV